MNCRLFNLKVTFVICEAAKTFDMIAKFWMIIKDDSKMTFEVCHQAGNDNAFSTRIYAMQKAGMNVSCMTPPVTNKTSSKDLIKIVGYNKEDGLYDRLLIEFREITMRSAGEW